MTLREKKALGGRKGNIVIATRAALRAQHMAMLIEQGIDPERARRKIGVAPRTAKRYRLTWGF